MTENELYHHGVKGMHWGVRRYQNKDGTLTEAGEKRLAQYKEKQTAGADAKWDKRLNKSSTKASKYYHKGEYALSAHKDRKAAKYDAKYVKAQRIHMGQQAMKELERTAIQKMSYKDMQHEKIVRGANVAADALVTLGSISLHTLGMTSLVVVPVTNLDKLNTNMRVPKETQKNIKKSVNSVH